LLSSREEGFERQRYLEIYKLRNTAHLKGRHNMTIGPGGLRIFPRYTSDDRSRAAPPALETSRRLRTGVAGLDELLGGGLLERSVTLVSGSAGIGKSTLGLQFILEGIERNERGLFVALEEGPDQLLASAEALGLPLRAATERGLVELVYLAPEHVRAQQFLAILDDKIRESGTRRLVLDSASNLVMQSLPPDDVRQLLYGLAGRFKKLGVTSMLTLEANSLYSSETVTERGFSPITDNLIMLRYVETPAGHRSAVTVVKTRGSGHDWRRHYFHIGPGGLRIEPQAESSKQP
jgi:circadian clock protein KaiC